MRVLVVGGRGYLGRKVLHALSRLPGCEAVCGGRTPGRGGVAIDLRWLETFSAMHGFDAVVNCADTLTAPPEAAIAFALKHGLRFVETSSEPVAVRRLLEQFRGDGARRGTGMVLLGAGIFTGLSNLLAAEAAKAAAPCAELRLGIRWSPFSAGGGGMVNLVPHLVSVQTVRYEDGRALRGPSIEAGPNLPFPTGVHRTMHVPFAEPAMLRVSTGVAAVSAFAAFRPSLLAPLFLATPASLLRTRIARAFMWLQFTLLRRLVLRWRNTPVEMVAVATPEGGHPAKVVSLFAPDGMALAGAAAAAMVQRLASDTGRAGGLYMPDECFTLESILDDAAALGAPCRLERPERHS